MNACEFRYLLGNLQGGYIQRSIIEAVRSLKLYEERSLRGEKGKGKRQSHVLLRDWDWFFDALKRDSVMLLRQQVPQKHLAKEKLGIIPQPTLNPAKFQARKYITRAVHRIARPLESTQAMSSSCSVMSMYCNAHDRLHPLTVPLIALIGDILSLEKNAAADRLYKSGIFTGERAPL